MPSQARPARITLALEHRVALSLASADWLGSHCMRFRSSLVASCVWLLGACDTATAERVLFIGNSFTYGSGSAVRFYRSDTVTDLNDEGIGGVPALFKSFADQAGLDYDVALETRGGTGPRLPSHREARPDRGPTLGHRRRARLQHAGCRCAARSQEAGGDEPRARGAAARQEPRRRSLPDGDVVARGSGVSRRRRLGGPADRDDGDRHPRRLRRGRGRRGCHGHPRRRSVEPRDANRRCGFESV